MTNAIPGEATPYQRMGGIDTLRRIVNLMFPWISLDDDLWLTYFDGHSIATIKAHLVLLLCELTGGPQRYIGRDLGDAHRHLRVTPAAFKRVANYLNAALLVVQADDDIIAAVMGKAAALAPVIVSAPDR